MRNSIFNTALLAASLSLGLVGCSSGGGSGSEANQERNAEHIEMIDKAVTVDDDKALAACDDGQIDNLYFVKSTNSFKTCVNNAGKFEYQLVNVERSAFEGTDSVMSFPRYNMMPRCGSYTKKMVVYVATSGKIMYCGKHEGYTWWRSWQQADIEARDAACSIADKGNGEKTITCGDRQTTIRDGRLGPKGYKGDKGAKGEKGDKGRTGRQGEKGDRGDTGRTGKDGIDGKDGEVGKRGPRGPRGRKGPKGSQGQEGPVGEQGDRGPTGAKGPQGASGAPGAEGPKGEQGKDAVMTCRVEENPEGGHLLICGDVSVPITIPGAEPKRFIKDISGGSVHTCVVSDIGEVWCWGNHKFGQLGRGLLAPDPDADFAPGKVPGLSGVEMIDSSQKHVCALTDAAKVFCWGSNQFVELGQPNTTLVSDLPVEVPAFAGATHIDVNDRTTCAIMADKTVKCVGFIVREIGSQLFTTPQPAPGFADISSLAVGFLNICAADTQGDVFCLGINGQGQLGIGTLTPGEHSAKPVSGIPDPVAEVKANLNNYCARTTKGDVYCWGVNAFGAIGQPFGTFFSNVPVKVANLDKSLRLYDRGTGYCSLSTNGPLQCWGSNQFGEFGLGVTTPIGSPTPVTGVPGLVFTDFFDGSNGQMGCAKKADDSVVCWGKHSDYNLTTAPFPASEVSAAPHGPWTMDLSFLNAP